MVRFALPNSATRLPRPALPSMHPLLDQLPRRWWDNKYKVQVCNALQSAARHGSEEELAALCGGLLNHLLSPGETTRAVQLLDFATHPSREGEICSRLLAQDDFRLGLEAAAGQESAASCLASSRVQQRNCRAALKMLHARSEVQKEFEFPCATGGSIRILENRGFGAQATCKQDGTLRTGGVVWEAAHCLVDLMQRLGPAAFRGRSVLELGAGCGYVGIAAAKMGAIVTVTDRSDHLEHLRLNVKLNGLENSVRVAELDWEMPAASGLCAYSYDWILASDCVYEQDSHAPLAKTLCGFSKADATTVILISQETRSETHTSFFRSGQVPNLDRSQSVQAEDGFPVRGGQGGFLHFEVREVEASAYQRPESCFAQQEFRIFCLTKTALKTCEPHAISEAGPAAKQRMCTVCRLACRDDRVLDQQAVSMGKGLGTIRVPVETSVAWEPMTSRELCQHIADCHAKTSGSSHLHRKMRKREEADGVLTALEGTYVACEDLDLDSLD